MSLQGNRPVEIELIGYIETDNMKNMEKELHIKFKEYHSHGEWFHQTDELCEYIALHAKAISKRIFVGNSKLTKPSIKVK